VGSQHLELPIGLRPVAVGAGNRTDAGY